MLEDWDLSRFCTHLNRKKGKLSADSDLIKCGTRRGLLPTLFKSSSLSSKRVH